MRKAHTIETSLMLPVTSQEFINLLAHYYRGEIARMAGWRDRIDRTTNWAITCVAAMLSISWSGPAGHHEILLFAMAIVLLLLAIESRRYRFFDVYRRRVRMIERYYYAQVFDLQAADALPSWASDLGRDLRRPLFVISRTDAFCCRLRRNYIWMFAILLVGWTFQVFRIELSAGSIQVISSSFANAGVGPLTGMSVAATVGTFYLVLISLALVRMKRDSKLTNGDVHV